MQKPRLWYVVASILVTIVAAFSAYASRLSPGVASSGFQLWLHGQREAMSIALLVAAVAGGVKEGVRAYLGTRHAARPVLQRMIDEFSKTHFKDRERHNRVTLFKKTRGWKIFWLGVLKIGGWRRPHRWKYLRSIHHQADYVGVYVRARGSRNRHSSVAWRISDVKDDCEGVAGLIWEEGGMVFIECQAEVDTAKLSQVNRLEDLAADNPTAIYASATNIKSLDSIRPLRNFGRFFCGTVIKHAGEPWGVLLIDSQDDVCKFGEGSVTRDKLGELALSIGQIVG